MPKKKREAYDNGAKQLDGIALNATEADRTITKQIPSDGEKVVLLVEHTNSAATTIDIAVHTSYDGTNWTPLQSGAISSGTRTLSDFSDSKTVSNDDEFAVEYDVTGHEWVKWVFSGTSADGSDTVDVYGYLWREA